MHRELYIIHLALSNFGKCPSFDWIKNVDRKRRIREGTFFYGGQGRAGASELRVISKFFYKLGRIKPILLAFIRNRGRVTVFFWQ